MVFFIADNIDIKVAKNVKMEIIRNGGSCQNRCDNKIDFCVVDAFSKPPDIRDICDTVITYMWVQRLVILSMYNLYNVYIC